ncbi:lysophospholipid acyltransferase family protein [Pseudopelagicola sp. nBUS_19]|uniref:lysophospholipid acyltransferase family protein n=1 Tax=unclassified Pseudopelagicola TaxID=2649563 RepID=UPI003EBC41D1
MLYAVQWMRSLIFNIQMYLAGLVIGILFLPWALISLRGARTACLTYCRWVCWTAGWMINLKTEVRGTPPTGELMIASKHQSLLDVIMIFGSLPAGKFIMKRELMWVPILGQYGLRVGCVPINRGQRGTAIKKMLADVAAGSQIAGQLIIYPQGTRVAPGTKKPFKVGTFALYQQLNQPCVPAATNVGVFWPRQGVYRKPGTAIIEFLEPIPIGLCQSDFMKMLKERVETCSDALMREGGFDPDEIRN